MQLSDILKPEGVRLIHQTTSKKRLFHELGDMAFACYGFDGELATEALQAREALGPTGVGHGVAIPHARMAAVKGVCGMFVRLEKPLDFDAVDRQPVDLLFTLFAPEGAGVDHLKALALVSRTMRERDVRAKLRANDDPAALHAILTEGMTSEAA